MALNRGSRFKNVTIAKTDTDLESGKKNATKLEGEGGNFGNFKKVVFSTKPIGATLEIVVHTCMLHLESTFVYTPPSVYLPPARHASPCSVPARHASAYRVHDMYTLAVPTHGHIPAIVFAMVYF